MPRFLLALATAVLAVAVPFTLGAGAASGPTELFFSEYIEGSSNNKALEIYNGTGAPVDLAAGGYSVKMFFNGSSSAGLTITLTGTVAAGDVYVLAQSSADPAILAQADQTNGAGWFNGDDAVALFKGTTPVDVIGQIGFDPGSEWGTGDTSTADNTLRRKASVTAGDPDGSNAFDPAAEWDGYPKDTFDGLGSHVGAPPGEVVATCASISTLTGRAGSADVSATDSDGTVTSIAIASVTPAPAAGTISVTAVTPASGVGGTATATVTADDALPAGTYAVDVVAANDDAPPQTGHCTVQVTVRPVLEVGDVQGPGDASPYVGQTVTVRGVVAEKTLDQAVSGSNRYDSYGFYLQSRAGAGDGNPATSDGVFVYLGRYPDFTAHGYVPEVGDELVLSASVSEYYGLTELSRPRLEWLVGSGRTVTPFVADPPADSSAAAAYWESHEGMQAQIPVDSVVDSPRHVYATPLDSEFYVVTPTAPVFGRSDPFARRAFRDAHPLDDLPGLFDDGNGYRVLVTDSGVKALAGDNAALLEPTHTFQTLAAPAVGGVDYAYGKYSIDVSTQPQLAAGVDPSTNAPPQAFDRARAYSVANFNVENLYDFRDDPTDGCDFAGNPGCPGVDPPFDYVPASQAAYDARVGEIAHQVVDALHSPDVIAIAESEDEDLDGDGQPDPLQDLEAQIAAIGGPAYRAAFDRDGADARGIVSAFLYRADRVELLPPFAGPAVDYRGAPLPYDADVQNPKALNAVLPGDVDTSTGVDGSNVFTRAPEVGHFRIWRTRIGLSEFRDAWVVANHFSSGPDTRVGQRREQAAYNAAIVQALEAAEPGARVDVAGDLNVYPRPDDPFATPSDQLGPLYEAGLHNLFDTLVAEHPSSAYSYVYEGQAQTLDQQFASPGLFADLQAVNVAHVNADWSSDVTGDGNRGTSDHDPMVARYDGRATLAGLRQLVLFYGSTGKVADRAERVLLDRLDRAAGFRQAGQENPYANQLHAFAQDATHGKPGEVDPAAGAALAAEAAAVLAG